jgi:hypothetical protein
MEEKIAEKNNERKNCSNATTRESDGIYFLFEFIFCDIMDVCVCVCVCVCERERENFVNPFASFLSC